VIVDLAVEAGGNCPISELGKVVVKHGVTLVGHDNVPGRLAKDASLLFAKNLFNFLSPHADQEKKTLNFDWEDETVVGTLLCRDGQVVHPMLTGGK
jgi:NAD(P) transhydrogenase subunit alpha